MSGGTFNPGDISAAAEYTLEALADLAPISVSALRRAIRDRNLTARKKGKRYLVEGREFLRWWKTS